MQFLVPSSTHRARSGRGGRVRNCHRLDLALDAIHSLALSCLVHSPTASQSLWLAGTDCIRKDFLPVPAHTRLGAGVESFKLLDGGKGSHSRGCKSDENRACNRICLRDDVSGLYGCLKSRYYDARNCASRYSRIRCLYDGRSRLGRCRRCNKCTCWLDRGSSDRLSWQSLRSRDKRR